MRALLLIPRVLSLKAAFAWFLAIAACSPTTKCESQTFSAPSNLEETIREYAKQIVHVSNLQRAGGDREAIAAGFMRIEQLGREIMASGEAGVPSLVRVYDDSLAGKGEGDHLRLRKFIAYNFLNLGVRPGYEPVALRNLIDRIITADPDADVRLNALETKSLRDNASNHVDALLKTMKDPDLRIRDAAAGLFSSIRDPKFVPLQLDFVKHEDSIFAEYMFRAIVENTKSTSEQKLTALKSVIERLRTGEEGSAPIIWSLEKFTDKTFGKYQVDKQTRRVFNAHGITPQPVEEKKAIVEKWKAWFKENEHLIEWSARDGIFKVKPRQIMSKEEIEKLLVECAGLLARIESPPPSGKPKPEQVKLEQQVAEIAQKIADQGDEILPVLDAIYRENAQPEKGDKALRHALLTRILVFWVNNETSSTTVHPPKTVVDIVQDAVLNDPDVTIRVSAARLVEKHPSVHLKIIPKILEDSNAEIQNWAAVAVGRYSLLKSRKIEDPELKKEILRQIKRKDLAPRVRYVLSSVVLDDEGFEAADKLDATVATLEGLVGKEKDWQATQLRISRQIGQDKTSEKPEEMLKWLLENKGKLEWDTQKRSFRVPENESP
jgi:hypothetical protein